MIFKIVVDAVVQAVSDVVFIPQEAHHGMRWADGKKNLLSYADDGRIIGWDPEWVQDVLTVTVTMFCRMGLDTDFENTKKIVCSF